jgi:hypothetical protein
MIWKGEVWNALQVNNRAIKGLTSLNYLEGMSVQSNDDIRSSRKASTKSMKE